MRRTSNRTDPHSLAAYLLAQLCIHLQQLGSVLAHSGSYRQACLLAYEYSANIRSVSCRDRLTLPLPIIATVVVCTLVSVVVSGCRHGVWLVRVSKKHGRTGPCVHCVPSSLEPEKSQDPLIQVAIAYQGKYASNKTHRRTLAPLEYAPRTP